MNTALPASSDSVVVAVMRFLIIDQCPPENRIVREAGYAVRAGERRSAQTAW